MTADLVTHILDDHELIRTRFSLLEDVGPDGREPLFRELVALLVQHEAMESIVLHPTVHDHLPNGGKLADARRAEEQEAEERLAELVDMDASSDVFAAALAQLRDEVLAHAAAEERDVLPKLRQNLDADELQRLGDRYERLKAAAPTRPHPTSGQGVVSNLFGGPMLGLVDRVRDSLVAAVGDAGDARAPAASGGHAYEDWTVEQLQDRAAELDIEGRSTMDKAELVTALRRHNANA